jgi:hypothetical protein
LKSLPRGLTIANRLSHCLFAKADDLKLGFSGRSVVCRNKTTHS